MKPQDIMVALKLCSSKAPSSFAALGKSLGMSASEVHAAVLRLKESKLVDPVSKQVYRERLQNIIVPGVPYAFPVAAKELTRGLPTAWAAPVMKDSIAYDPMSAPVWPSPEGVVKGVAVKPLYSSAVKASNNDSELYDLLALVDAIRLGRVRERKIAEEELEKRLK